MFGYPTAQYWFNYREMGATSNHPDWLVKVIPQNSVRTKEGDLWEKPHGRVTQMRPLLRKNYENTSVASENAWKSVVGDDFCGHLRPERSFCAKFQSDMWATNLKNHTYNEVLLQGSMGRRWSTMLRSCFSSAGTGSILKIKGRLEEYKIQGNCLTTFFFFFSLPKTEAWENFISIRTIARGRTGIVMKGWALGVKNPISHSLWLKKRTTSYCCPQNVPISLLQYSHSRLLGWTTVFISTNVTQIVLFICTLACKFCQFGCKMHFSQTCANTFITLKQYSAAVSAAIVSNISHLHLHFLKGFHFAALRQ